MMRDKNTTERNPDIEAVENALIAKFGEEAYRVSKSKAKFKADMAHAMKPRRIELDMDQKDLAKKLNTTQQQLSRYEVGENSPTLERVFDLCKALKLELIVREKDHGKELIHI